LLVSKLNDTIDIAGKAYPYSLKWKFEVPNVILFICLTSKSHFLIVLHLFLVLGLLFIVKFGTEHGKIPKGVKI
jgi:hypothetical protein